MSDETVEKTETNGNKGLLYGGGCCGLVIVIFLVYLFVGVSHPMDHNRSIDMYGVNVSIPEEMQGNVTETTIKTGKNYVFEDPNKNFSVSVSDDPANDIVKPINYDSSLGYYGKTTVKNKTVVVYANDQDTMERVLVSAH